MALIRHNSARQRDAKGNSDAEPARDPSECSPKTFTSHYYALRSYFHSILKRQPFLQRSIDGLYINWPYWKSTLWFPDDPGFPAFLRSEWPDLLILAITSLIPLFIYAYVPPLPTIYFPLLHGDQLLAPQYAYPKRSEYITTAVSAILSFSVPFAVMGLCSIFLIGSFWDANTAIMGLSFALTTATLIQNLIKLFIGGPRPHFLSVCDPSPNWRSLPGAGYQNIYFTREICMNPDNHAIDMALMSFPSGHCAATFAGFGFLALWLNAKFKVFAESRSRLWQLLLFSAPLVLAALLSLSKMADYWHHGVDVLVGGGIGIVCALGSYCMGYCAVWDWRMNHIPRRYHSGVFLEIADVSMRGLTAIDFAGWRNKWSEEREAEKGSDEGEVRTGEEAGRMMEEEARERLGDEAQMSDLKAAQRQIDGVDEWEEVELTAKWYDFACFFV